MKPQPVFLYNRYMSGVDLTDQFLQYYSFLRKSVKWSKKFFVHCLNIVILNAHILHNVSKEAVSDAGLGDSYKPKKFTSYWCSICKCALCIDPCFRLYHTEKDYTSEIIKIATMSVKPIQKDAQHVQKDAQHVQKMLNMSKEATQSK